MRLGFVLDLHLQQGSQARKGALQPSLTSKEWLFSSAAELSGTMLLGALREAKNLGLFESYLIVNCGNSPLYFKKQNVVKHQSVMSTK